MTQGSSPHLLRLLCVYAHTYVYVHTGGASRWLSDRESACNAGDTGDMGSILNRQIILNLQTHVYVGALVAKNPPAGAGDVGDPGLIPEDPLEEGRAAHSSILAWRVP